jgi:hypothetical protein
MKKILDLIFSYCGSSLWTWLRFESIKLYANTSEALRGLFIHITLIFLFVIIALSGFIFIHLALFFLVPWSIETKALILLILGSIYFLLPIIFVLILYSRKQWARASGLESFAEHLSGLKNK